MNTATDTKTETEEALAGHMLDKETLEEIRAFEAGEGIRTFHDLDSFFKWLDEDDEGD